VLKQVLILCMQEVSVYLALSNGLVDSRPDRLLRLWYRGQHLPMHAV
jgi:hypothetical protein